MICILLYYKKGLQKSNFLQPHIEGKDKIRILFLHLGIFLMAVPAGMNFRPDQVQ
jgi:hypothetical protein